VFANGPQSELVTFYYYSDRACDGHGSAAAAVPRDTRPCVGIRYSLTGPRSCRNHRRRCRHYRYHYVCGSAVFRSDGRSVDESVGRSVCRSVCWLVGWPISCESFSISPRTPSWACGAICRRRLRQRILLIYIRLLRRSVRARGLARLCRRRIYLSYIARPRRRHHTRELSRVHVRHTLRVLRSATLGRGQCSALFYYFLLLLFIYLFVLLFLLFRAHWSVYIVII